MFYRIRYAVNMRTSSENHILDLYLLLFFILFVWESTDIKISLSKLIATPNFKTRSNVDQ